MLYHYTSIQDLEGIFRESPCEKEFFGGLQDMIALEIRKKIKLT